MIRTSSQLRSMPLLSGRRAGRAENTGEDTVRWTDQWVDSEEAPFIFLLILIKWETRLSADGEKGRGCGRCDWEVNGERTRPLEVRWPRG